MSHYVRLATSADTDAAASLLASAFDTYAWTRWALPEDAYAERLEEVQRLYLLHALKHGLVFVDIDMYAVAAFMPPAPPAPSESTQQRVGELHGARLQEVAALSIPSAPANSWTLETVGVDPRHQGTGLGSALIAAGLETTDVRSEPVALETSDERNVRLYERLGFRTYATTVIPDGPTVFSMRRAARSR